MIECVMDIPVRSHNPSLDYVFRVLQIMPTRIGFIQEITITGFESVAVDMIDLSCGLIGGMRGKTLAIGEMASVSRGPSATAHR